MAFLGIGKKVKGKYAGLQAADFKVILDAAMKKAEKLNGIKPEGFSVDGVPLTGTYSEFSRDEVARYTVGRASMPTNETGKIDTGVETFLGEADEHGHVAHEVIEYRGAHAGVFYARERTRTLVENIVRDAYMDDQLQEVVEEFAYVDRTKARELLVTDDERNQFDTKFPEGTPILASDFEEFMIGADHNSGLVGERHKANQITRVRTNMPKFEQELKTIYTTVTGTPTPAQITANTALKRIMTDKFDRLRIAEQYGGRTPDGKPGMLEKYAKYANVPVGVLALHAIAAVIPDNEGNKVWGLTNITVDGKTEQRYVLTKSPPDSDGKYYADEVFRSAYTSLGDPGLGVLLCDMFGIQPPGADGNFVLDEHGRLARTAPENMKTEFNSLLPIINTIQEKRTSANADFNVFGQIIHEPTQLQDRTAVTTLCAESRKIAFDAALKRRGGDTLDVSGVYDLARVNERIIEGADNFVNSISAYASGNNMRNPLALMVGKLESDYIKLSISDFINIVTAEIGKAPTKKAKATGLVSEVINMSEPLGFAKDGKFKKTFVPKINSDLKNTYATEFAILVGNATICARVQEIVSMRLAAATTEDARNQIINEVNTELESLGTFGSNIVEFIKIREEMTMITELVGKLKFEELSLAEDALAEDAKKAIETADKGVTTTNSANLEKIDNEIKTLKTELKTNKTGLETIIEKSTKPFMPKSATRDGIGMVVADKFKEVFAEYVKKIPGTTLATDEQINKFVSKAMEKIEKTTVEVVDGKISYAPLEKVVKSEMAAVVLGEYAKRRGIKVSELPAAEIETIKTTVILPQLEGIKVEELLTTPTKNPHIDAILGQIEKIEETNRKIEEANKRRKAEELVVLNKKIEAEKVVYFSQSDSRGKAEIINYSFLTEVIGKINGLLGENNKYEVKIPEGSTLAAEINANPVFKAYVDSLPKNTANFTQTLIAFRAECSKKIEKLNESLFNYDVIIVPETTIETVDGSDITTTKFVQKVIDNPYRVKGEVSQDILDYFKITDELKILRELNKLPQGHPGRDELVARLPGDSQGVDYVARAQQLNDDLTRIGEAYKNMSDEEKLAFAQDLYRVTVYNAYKNAKTPKEREAAKNNLIRVQLNTDPTTSVTQVGLSDEEISRHEAGINHTKLTFEASIGLVKVFTPEELDNNVDEFINFMDGEESINIINFYMGAYEKGSAEYNYVAELLKGKGAVVSESGEVTYTDDLLIDALKHFNKADGTSFTEDEIKDIVSRRDANDVRILINDNIVKPYAANAEKVFTSLEGLSGEYRSQFVNKLITKKFPGVDYESASPEVKAEIDEFRSSAIEVLGAHVPEVVVPEVEEESVVAPTITLPPVEKSDDAELDAKVKKPKNTKINYSAKGCEMALKSIKKAIAALDQVIAEEKEKSAEEKEKAARIKAQHVAQVKSSNMQFCANTLNGGSAPVIADGPEKTNFEAISKIPLNKTEVASCFDIDGENKTINVNKVIALLTSKTKADGTNFTVEEIKKACAYNIATLLGGAKVDETGKLVNGEGNNIIDLLGAEVQTGNGLTGVESDEALAALDPAMKLIMAAFAPELFSDATLTANAEDVVKVILDNGIEMTADNITTLMNGGSIKVEKPKADGSGVEEVEVSVAGRNITNEITVKVGEIKAPEGERVVPPAEEEVTPPPASVTPQENAMARVGYYKYCYDKLTEGDTRTQEEVDSVISAFNKLEGTVFNDCFNSDTLDVQAFIDKFTSMTYEVVNPDGTKTTKNFTVADIKLVCAQTLGACANGTVNEAGEIVNGTEKPEKIANDRISGDRMDKPNRNLILAEFGAKLFGLDAIKNAEEIAKLLKDNGLDITPENVTKLLADKSLMIPKEEVAAGEAAYIEVKAPETVTNHVDGQIKSINDRVPAPVHTPDGGGMHT